MVSKSFNKKRLREVVRVCVCMCVCVLERERERVSWLDASPSDQYFLVSGIFFRDYRSFFQMVLFEISFLIECKLDSSADKADKTTSTLDVLFVQYTFRWYLTRNESYDLVSGLWTRDTFNEFTYCAKFVELEISRLKITKQRLVQLKNKPRRKQAQTSSIRRKCHRYCF
jgi:hypothetical protein